MFVFAAATVVYIQKDVIMLNTVCVLLLRSSLLSVCTQLQLGGAQWKP